MENTTPMPTRMEARIFGEKEPLICLKCAIVFPYTSSLLMRAEDGKHIKKICPICCSDQVLEVNNVIAVDSCLREYIQNCKISWSSPTKPNEIIEMDYTQVMEKITIYDDYEEREGR